MRRSLFGKCMTIIVRNAMVLQVIHYSYTIVSKIPSANSDELSTKFRQDCEDIISSLDPSIFVIDVPILKRALTLTDIFNISKLLFFQYKIDPNDSSDIIFDKILTEAKEKVTEVTTGCRLNGSNNKPISTEIVNQMKKIMEKDHSILWPRLISSGNGNCNEIIKQAMDELAFLGLGRVDILSAGNGYKVKHFFKIKQNELVKNAELLKRVQQLGLDISKVIDSLIIGEARPPPAIINNNNKKRSQSNITPSPNKSNSPLGKKPCNDRVKIMGAAAPTMVSRELLNKVVAQAESRALLNGPIVIYDSDPENTEDALETSPEANNDEELAENLSKSSLDDSPQIHSSQRRIIQNHKSPIIIPKKNISSTQPVQKTLLQSLLESDDDEQDFRPPVNQTTFAIPKIISTTDIQATKTKVPEQLPPRRSPRFTSSTAGFNVPQKSLPVPPTTVQSSTSSTKKYNFTKPQATTIETNSNSIQQKQLPNKQLTTICTNQSNRKITQGGKNQKKTNVNSVDVCQTREYEDEDC